ncbi:MAG: SPOR domain-containing protein [Clostridium sp.]
MRYTRYNHNRRRGGNGGKGSFIASLIAVVAIAIVLGVVVGKVIFNDGISTFSPNDNQGEGNKAQGEGNQNTKPDESNASSNSSSNSESKEFYYLQCGVFSTQENANATINKLPSGNKGFAIEEDSKFKVLVGVFTSEVVEGKSNELKAAGIDNIKVKYTIDQKTTDDKMKIEIIDGYTKILSKLNEKDVKSIKTNEFKDWLANNIENVKSEDKDINLLIDNIKKLPEEITKDSAVEINKVIYEVVKKYKL